MIIKIVILITTILLPLSTGQKTAKNVDYGECSGLLRENEILRRQLKEAKELPVLMQDCGQSGLRASGIYVVERSDKRQIPVYCDMTTEGGGWLVFQRRRDGSENFNRNWKDYQRGFGELDGEFWLGNDNLHEMTKNHEYELRIDMEDFEGNKAYAKYSNFSVADASDMYRLRIWSYSGTAGDSMSYQKGMQFSTPDVDNDNESGDCAASWKGGWWFNSCYKAFLNGPYFNGGRCSSSACIVYQSFKGNLNPLKFTEMKIRPLP